MRERISQVAIIPFNLPKKRMVTVNALEAEPRRIILSIKCLPERNMDPSKKSASAMFCMVLSPTN